MADLEQPAFHWSRAVSGKEQTCQRGSASKGRRDYQHSRLIDRLSIELSSSKKGAFTSDKYTTIIIESV
jgi:hypothetical protein